MIIRSLKREELPQVAKLEQLCFSHPWSEKSLTDSFDNPSAVFLAAFDGEVRGYVGAEVNYDGIYILNVAVHPDFRRQGIGKRLIESLIENSSEEISFITLEVRPTNSAAVEMYASLGFEEVGRRKNYYSEPTEDAIIMTKELHSS